MTKTIQKFFIASWNYAEYDVRMLKELADALVRCGYPAEIIFPDQFSLLKYHPKSVLLGMNLGRSSFPNLDPRTPVVTWFQDVFPGDKESYEAHATPNDFFVSLGSPEPLGLSSRSEFYRGILFTGVSGRILSADYRMPEARNLYDFGLAAGVPLPMINPVLKSGLFGLLETILRKAIRRQGAFHFPSTHRIARKMSCLVERRYRPLAGEHDMLMLADELETLLGGETIDMHWSERLASQALSISWIRSLLRLQKREAKPLLERLISYYAQSYPRVMDRKRLVELATKSSNTLAICGPGMDRWDWAKPFFKGIITDEDSLARFYRACKINLSNNTNGLGMHSRTFGVFAARGGCLAFHKSTLNPEGALMRYFEPGIHFIEYDAANFSEVMECYLRDEDKRAAMAMAAFEALHGHTWENRVSQLLGFFD